MKLNKVGKPMLGGVSNELGDVNPWWVDRVADFQKYPSNLTRMAATLTSLLLNERTDARSRVHPRAMKLRGTLNDHEIIQLMESNGFKTNVEGWWKAPVADQAAPWMGERKDAYHIRVMVGLLLLNPDATIHMLRKSLNDKRLEYSFSLRQEGLAYRLVVHDYRANNRSDFVYASQVAGVLQVMCTIPGVMNWEWFPRYGDMKVMISTFYLKAAHGFELNPPPATEAVLKLEQTVRIDRSESVMLELMYNPLWSAEALQHLLSEDRRCFVATQILLPMLKLQEALDPDDHSLLEVKPTGTVFEFHVTLYLWANRMTYPVEKCAMVCETLNRHRLIAMHPNTPFQILRDMEGKNWGEQQLMNMLYQPRSLKFPINLQAPDVTLPQVRGDRKEGNFHYPVTLPPQLKTKLLTKGQVLTQEFMHERETTPFVDLVGCRIPRDAVTYLVSPYLRAPITQLEVKQAEEVGRICGGIIADETGTGKTLSMLLRCIANPGETSLIVVPDNLVHQWSGQITQHTLLRVWEDQQYMNTDEVEVKAKRPKYLPPVLGDHDVVILHRTQDYAHHRLAQRMPTILLVSHSAIRSHQFQALVDTFQFNRLVVDEGHSIRQKTLDRLQLVRRHSTWVVSATPYENTTILAKMLGLDRLVHLLGIHDEFDMGRSLKRMMTMIYRFCMVRNVFDRSHLQVDTIKQYCDMSEAETQFFREISDLVEAKINNRVPRQLHRFFRVMERLGAGGHVHKRLILQILRRIFEEAPVNHHQHHRAALPNHGMDRMTQSKTVAFCASTDDCAVCLCPFVEPVQTKCNHVYCKVCLQGMFDLNIRHCAFCQGPLTPPGLLPLWPQNDPARLAEAEEAKKRVREGEKKNAIPAVAAPADGPGGEANVAEPDAIALVDADVKLARDMEARALALAQDANVEHKDYRVLLHGASDEMVRVASAALQRELINMQGKQLEVGRQLEKFVAERSPGDQLVMFTKEQLSASAILQVIRSKGLTVLCAGIMGARKLTSVANIEKFRQGQADVLLISNRYSDGFDLFMAKEIWLLNTDLSAARMEQSQGRIMRVVQKYDKVVVRVFLYRNTFDEFLWEFRKQLNMRAGFNKSHLMLFYYFSRRMIPGTLPFRVQTIVNRLFPTFAGNISAMGSSRLIFDPITFDLDTETITSHGGRYSMGMVSAELIANVNTIKQNLNIA